MAVTREGQVCSWGTNLYGALGLGKETTAVQKPSLIQSLVQQQVHIVKISGKFHHSIFLDSNGNVFMSGKGDKGQLGFDIQKF
jgi:alpha-tubulin suppressor-like RCC1 family protein